MFGRRLTAEADKLDEKVVEGRAERETTLPSKYFVSSESSPIPTYYLIENSTRGNDKHRSVGNMAQLKDAFPMPLLWEGLQSTEIPRADTPPAIWSLCLHCFIPAAR